MSIEKGWFRIMTELDEDDLFPPHVFEIVEEYMLSEENSGS